MALFRRRPRTDLALERGERVLSVAQVTEAVEVVATTERLVLRREGAPDWVRRWVEIDTARWDGDDRALQVVDVTGGGTTVDLVQDDHLALAQVVRERVQSTLVTWTSVEVPGGEVRVVVRKDGDSLLLQEIPSRRADASGEAARAAVVAARRRLASSVGLVEPPG